MPYRTCPCEVVCQHRVKVYAPGAPGAPPMSMPHLDYRTIGGKDRIPIEGSKVLKGPKSGAIALHFTSLYTLSVHWKNHVNSLYSLSLSLSLSSHRPYITLSIIEPDLSLTWSPGSALVWSVRLHDNEVLEAWQDEHSICQLCQYLYYIECIYTHIIPS